MPKSKNRKEHSVKKKQRVQKQEEAKNAAKNNLKFISKALPLFTTFK